MDAPKTIFMRGNGYMKKSELIARGFTAEQINYIFAENGKDINAEKLKTQKVVKEITELKELFNSQSKIATTVGVDANVLDTQQIKNISILNDIEEQKVCVNFEKVKDLLKIQITFPINDVNIEK